MPVTTPSAIRVFTWPAAPAASAATTDVAQPNDDKADGLSGEQGVMGDEYGVVKVAAVQAASVQAAARRLTLAQTVANPRGVACSRSMPPLLISTSSPVCTPARPSGVATLGWITTVMPARNGSSGTGPAGPLLVPRIRGRDPP